MTEGHDADKKRSTTSLYNDDTVSDVAGFIESAAILTFWSVIVINEGTFRFLQLNPSQLDTSNINQILGLIGGICEVVFALIGLYLGCSALILKRSSPSFLKTGLFFQFLLSSYVFFLFVIYFNVNGIINAQPFDGISLRMTKFLRTLGLFNSIHFCFALQGGQFLFMSRLVDATAGGDFMKQSSRDAMRAVFWNANLGLSGIWTLVTGALLTYAYGVRQVMPPYVFPPNVGTLPILTIGTGALMMISAVAGMWNAFSKTAPTSYFVTSFTVFVVALVNFGIGQFGTFADARMSGAVALHNGLVFMITFLGPYFVFQASRDIDASMV